MKFSLKRIVWWVAVAMAAIFAYQAYWLNSLYEEEKANAEATVRKALVTSDFKEIMVRLERIRREAEEHGTLTVEAKRTSDSMYSININSTGKPAIAKEIQIVDKDVVYVQIDSAEMEGVTEDNRKMTVIHKKTNKLHVKNDGVDSLMMSRTPLEELTNYYQKGLRYGVDQLMEVDMTVYDSLFTEELRLSRLAVPHRTELVKTGAQDTVVAVVRTGNYKPSARAEHYRYEFDLKGERAYCVMMEPFGAILLKQMSGILVASALILLLLLGVFVYLIYIVKKQKTLDEMKSDFTHNMTHELKTPIAVAYAANDALLNFEAKEDRERTRNYLKISLDNLRRLGSLVEQILEMSTERRREMTFYKQEVDVKAVLEPLAAQQQLQAEKTVHLQIEVEEGLRLYTDKDHLVNIVSNLLDNAVKYSGDEVRITIVAKREEKGISICVSDDGMGIPAGKQRYVFDKFYRVPHGHLHEVKGYGLGLFYVKKTMEKLGGRVELKSEENKGTQFKLYFDGTN